MATLRIYIPLSDGTDEVVHLPFHISKANIKKAVNAVKYLESILAKSYDLHYSQGILNPRRLPDKHHEPPEAA